jgi:hypothetical protein
MVVTKANLLAWVVKKTPPLKGCPATPPPTYDFADAPTGSGPQVFYRSDYVRFNAVTNAAEAKTALMKRVPPLTMKDVDEGMAEYNK